MIGLLALSLIHSDKDLGELEILMKNSESSLS